MTSAAAITRGDFDTVLKDAIARHLIDRRTRWGWGHERSRRHIIRWFDEMAEDARSGAVGVVMRAAGRRLLVLLAARRLPLGRKTWLKTPARRALIHDGKRFVAVAPTA